MSSCIAGQLFEKTHTRRKKFKSKIWFVLMHVRRFKFRWIWRLVLLNLKNVSYDTFYVVVDFAVGAPYDGPDEAGAVYIFQGSVNGVITKYSQVIYAESVQASNLGYSSLSTFGFSLSGGLDLDGNDYPDLAVGAYLSDTAYFFRYVIRSTVVCYLWR